MELAADFIHRNLGFYNKINVIWLNDIKYDSETKEKLEYRFICLIQEHIDTSDYSIVIIPFQDSEIVEFLTSNGYNHVIVANQSDDFLRNISKYCNNIFIGFANESRDINAKKILICSLDYMDNDPLIFDHRPSIYGVYFACCYGNYINVMKEQLSILIESGLYKKTKHIYIFMCLLNNDNQHQVLDLLKYYDTENKITLVATSQNLYEKFAINNYKNYINDASNYYLYYFHTKAVSRSEPLFTNVRQTLNYYTFMQYQMNINLLNYYDAVGCSLSIYPKIHFSGNFWWARSDYLNKLSEPINNTYLAPEMYIGSGPNGKFISLCQTTNRSCLSEHVNKTKADIISQLTTDFINNDESKYTPC